jgi:alanyl-tRNA synthetase
MTSANDIRSAFLDYFGQHDHAAVPSSPLVPRNDPTLMFTNAGMVQFKNVFTGAEKRDYSRAVTSQKCVRAGGKHNDLDNVGHTARHHTFFEMLGNFSFGDYFKDVAIELAWNLLVREFGMSADRLLVTVYSDDDEAHGLWRKISDLPDDRIIRIPTSDNFWSMGPTGPCGPCSEIFFDHGDQIAGGPPGSPDEDGDRFVEIWNLVFMQYEQLSASERVDLPRPSIDTGMGLERLAAVLQGTHDNYETDLLRVLIEASALASHSDPDGEHKISHRVIADHLRASSFLIADGVLPSNEGRGYVLRRIMRRAMRHAHLIGCADPHMHRLVPSLVGEMGQAFPELGRAQPLITETLKLEEERFMRTLSRGLVLLGEELGQLPNDAVLPGETAFKLYDTYGFPLDLTEDALRAQGRKVDTDGFTKAMERQKAEARAAWAGSGESATEAIWFEIRERHGATEFLGYETEVADGQVLAMVVGDEEASQAPDGTEVSIILNQTPLYGESGGQVGDTGELSFGDGGTVTITNTQKKLGDLIVHVGMVSGDTLKAGDDVHLTVDHGRRSKIRANHSVTHLLHRALRDVLGDHVTQKGSLVAADRMRFDISHPKPIAMNELIEVEARVNAVVQRNTAVSTALMTPDEAVEKGALALFGEKYGDEVRVVRMGVGGENDQAEDAMPYSVELCGGTHVLRTGDIAMFTITSEGAVASGVRRIEALTGDAARQHLNQQAETLRDTAGILKAPVTEVPERVASLLEDRKRLEKELADARRSLAMGGGSGGDTQSAVRDLGGVKFIGRRLDGVKPKELRGMLDDAKGQVGSGVVVLVAVNDGKAALVTGVTDDLTGQFDAVELIRIGAVAVGGKGGGGRPDMAQAGGPNGDQADAAIEAIVNVIENGAD